MEKTFQDATPTLDALSMVVRTVQTVVCPACRAELDVSDQFCRHCGVKSFYIPRSHPEGVSVNVRCLDPETIESVDITPFDGQNWEQNASNLSPISD